MICKNQKDRLFRFRDIDIYMYPGDRYDRENINIDHLEASD